MKKYVIALIDPVKGTTNSVLAYAPMDGCRSAARRTAADPATRGHGDASNREPFCPASCIWPRATRRRAGRSICLGPRIATSPWASSPGDRAPKCPTEPSRPPSRGCAIAGSIAGSRFCRGTPRPKCPRSRRSSRRSATSSISWPLGNRPTPTRRSPSNTFVLTVPASFDASARELTREAAIAAGLPADLVLLEEPQAAVYAWLSATGDRWRRALSVGDTLLVCDIGGGTTDLTLVGAAEEQGELVLAAHCRRQPSAGRRRQHGSRPGPLCGRPFRRKGRAARPVAIGRPMAFVPRGQRGPSLARRPRKTQHLGPRPRPKADRRHRLD